MLPEIFMSSIAPAHIIKGHPHFLNMMQDFRCYGMYHWVTDMTDWIWAPDFRWMPPGTAMLQELPIQNMRRIRSPITDTRFIRREWQMLFWVRSILPEILTGYTRHMEAEQLL